MNQIIDSEWGRGATVTKAANLAAEELLAEYGTAFTPEGGDHVCYVEDQQGVATLIVWRNYDGNAFIGIAWTRPDQRRKGLYRSILDHLKQVAKSQGLVGLSAGISPDNAVSLQVHEHLGFSSLTYVECGI